MPRVTKNENRRKSCVAILPAAGSSSRMKAVGNKLFCEICGTSVIVLTLKALQKSPFIDEIIIPTREDMIDDIKNLVRQNNITKVSAVIPGGKTRTESVLNGVLHAKGRFDLVAIHDAARPFVSQEIIEKTVLAASRFNAAAPGVPVKDTIKDAEGGIIKKTVPRDTLFGIQTPQIFDTDIITSALVKATRDNTPITDDCSAVESLGMRVIITNGDYFNIKITTPEDLIFGEAIYNALNRR
ncbi:MAG: 2-C-methyl-D-erythritol 4-phosphate cytidylyltransferase [Oscillospiraceae bacterium]|nr:2-C-methyl-D-erythritol 4-phosphate cytidylyltransferase [Oscillospiraceae bacterium]